MRRAIGLAAALAVLAAAGAASAAPAGAPRPEAPDTAGPGSLDLSIRARSLGVVPAEGSDAGALGLGPMRAPSGAGTMRWPSAVTEVAPGVYLYLAPACVPGEDPLSPRRIVPPRHR